VDDRAGTQDSLEAFLRLSGCWTDHAGNGAHALSRLAVSAPDAVVTDHVMPVLSGLDLVKEMRRAEGLKAVPAIVITALSDGEELARVRGELQALQPARLMRKPFDPAELVRALREMTGKGRAA
jgi:CheY-like chemotaxis protein